MLYLWILMVSMLAGGILIYNRLVRQSMLVKEAFSGIDVQLKRRADVIPNIVETVKGYSKFEQGTLEKIVALRAQVSSASGQKERAATENEVASALKDLFALAEAYPDLKANKSYLDLQKTLSETEDQIQYARRYFNGTVRDYNIAVELFPANLIARLFGYKRAEFFEIEYATERKVPDVKFSA